jgi:hypothetical protein
MSVSEPLDNQTQGHAALKGRKTRRGIVIAMSGTYGTQSPPVCRPFGGGRGGGTVQGFANAHPG